MEHKTGSLKEVFFFRKKIVLEQETRTQLMTAKLNGISLIRKFCPHDSDTAFIKTKKDTIGREKGI